MLCHAQGSLARTGRAMRGKPRHDVGRDVLEFTGNNIDRRRKGIKGSQIVIGGFCPSASNTGGRTGRCIRGIDMGVQAKLCRCNGNHPAQLAAAKDADTAYRASRHEGVSAT